MAWASQYSATFTKPLIRQLLAFLQRDQRAALDWVGGTDVLPDIVSYQLAPLTIPQFPAVLVAPMDALFGQDAVGSLDYLTKVYCAVAVLHQDAQVTAELVQDYLRAVDAVFNSVPLSDFYSAQTLDLPPLGAIGTTPLVAGSLKDLFVVAHHFDEIRRIKTQFACAATLELVIHREET